MKSIHSVLISSKTLGNTRKLILNAFVVLSGLLDTGVTEEAIWRPPSYFSRIGKKSFEAGK